MNVLRFLQTGDRTEYRDWLKRNNRWYGGDAWSKASDLYDARLCLEKYRKALKAEEDKEATFNQLPQVLIDFKNHLIDRWDRFDQWKREEIKRIYRDSSIKYEERSYKLRNQFGTGWYEFMYLTDTQIHNANVKAAELIVMNLVNRTIELCGQITDCSDLSLESDNQGYLIINGLVIGESGKARVESIGAGGYNIQRYHIRVLVKPVK